MDWKSLAVPLHATSSWYSAIGFRRKNEELWKSKNKKKVVKWYNYVWQGSGEKFSGKEWSRVWPVVVSVFKKIYIFFY